MVTLFGRYSLSVAAKTSEAEADQPLVSTTIFLSENNASSCVDSVRVLFLFCTCTATRLEGKNISSIFTASCSHHPGLSRRSRISLFVLDSVNLVRDSRISVSIPKAKSPSWM